MPHDLCVRIGALPLAFVDRAVGPEECHVISRNSRSIRCQFKAGFRKSNVAEATRFFASTFRPLRKLNLLARSSKTRSFTEVWSSEPLKMMPLSVMPSSSRMSKARRIEIPSQPSIIPPLEYIQFPCLTGTSQQLRQPGEELGIHGCRTDFTNHGGASRKA